MTLQANHPRDVLCFFPMDMSTEEITAYVFITQDVYSEFVFHTGTHQTINKQIILENVQKLMDNEEFQRYGQRPFTLVFHKYEEYRSDIEAIIQPHGGTMVIDDAYMTEVLMPTFKEIFQRLDEKVKNSKE